MLAERAAHVTTRQRQVFIKCANGEIELWIILKEVYCQKHSVCFEMCSSAYI